MNKLRLTILVAIAVLTTLSAGCANSSNTKSNAPTVRTIAGAGGKQLMIVESPSNVKSVINSLMAGKDKNFKLDRSQIPAAQLTVLDKFAAETTGAADCQTNSVDGCNSCCADGVSGALRHTTCGDFCDKVCGGQECF